MSAIRRDVLVLIFLVLCIRIPFLSQAIGGDEPYYIAAAEHAQIDPLHPNHTWFVFQGRDVTFRGYPHPPGNAWVLAGLLAACGDVKELPFHAAYLVFSLAAVLATYALARRFSPHPLMAALLFLAVPVFVINGNTLESDLPFVSFWLTGFALFVWNRRVLATVALCAAGLISYQSALALPILLIYDRKGWRSWIPAAAPLLTLVGWQCFEKISTGQFPAEVTAGYLSSYGYQRLELKLRNALALFIHSWFLLFPLLPAFAIWLGIRKRQWFLLAWTALFLGAAMVLFYAGAARYVLPIAAPLAILASSLRPVFTVPAFAAQLMLALALASVNYQQWNAYRDFARRIPPGHRVWANAEWGLRFYLESFGALPLHEHQWVPTGDIVVTSDLAYPVEFNHGGRALAPIAAQEVRSTLPLRLIGLHSLAGYATAAQGFLPFGISAGTVDRVHAEMLTEKQPAKSWLEMNAPEFDDQAISGTYRLEENRFRWTASASAFLLHTPAAPSKLSARFYIPDTAPARHIELLLEGKTVASMDCPGPGSYVVESPLLPPPSGPAVQAGLRADKSFTAPGDNRELGVILLGIGFQ